MEARRLGLDDELSKTHPDEERSHMAVRNHTGRRFLGNPLNHTWQRPHVLVADPCGFSGLVRDHPVVADRLPAIADHRRTFIEKVTEEHARGVEIIDGPHPVHIDG